jgi:hypothetical protein
LLQAGDLTPFLDIAESGESAVLPHGGVQSAEARTGDDSAYRCICAFIRYSNVTRPFYPAFSLRTEEKVDVWQSVQDMRDIAVNNTKRGSMFTARVLLCAV